VGGEVFLFISFGVKVKSVIYCALWLVLVWVVVYTTRYILVVGNVFGQRVDGLDWIESLLLSLSLFTQMVSGGVRGVHPHPNGMCQLG